MQIGNIVRKNAKGIKVKIDVRDKELEEKQRQKHQITCHQDHETTSINFTNSKSFQRMSNVQYNTYAANETEIFTSYWRL